MKNKSSFIFGIVLSFILNAVVFHFTVAKHDCDTMVFMDLFTIIALIAIPMLNIRIFDRHTEATFGFLLGTFINILCGCFGQEKGIYLLVIANVMCISYYLYKWNVKSDEEPEEVQETPRVVEKPKNTKMPIHPMQSLFEEKEDDEHGYETFSENFTKGNTNELEDEFKKWKNEQK